MALIIVKALKSEWNRHGRKQGFTEQTGSIQTVHCHPRSLALLGFLARVPFIYGAPLQLASSRSMSSLQHMCLFLLWGRHQTEHH